MLRASLALLAVLCLSSVSQAFVHSFDLTGYLDDGVFGTVAMTGKVSIDDQAQGQAIDGGGTRYFAPITAFDVAFAGHHTFGDVNFSGSGGVLDIYNDFGNQGDCVFVHDMTGLFSGTGYNGVGQASLVFTMKRSAELWNDEVLTNIAMLPDEKIKEALLFTGDGNHMHALVQNVSPAAATADATLAAAAFDPGAEAPVPEPSTMALTAFGLAGFGVWKRRRAR
jgi:hypothetical protein